jgi:uncharacterized protein
MVGPAAKRADDAPRYLDPRCPVATHVARAYALSQDFLAMVRERRGHDLEAWRAEASQRGIAARARFARGLQADLAAITAGRTRAWSTGVTEGHIHRLKLVTRQGNGRAGVALIRQRGLPAASGQRRVSQVSRAYSGPTLGPACRGHLRGLWMQGTRPVMTPLSYLAPTATVWDSPMHGRGLCAVDPMAMGDIVAMKGGYIAERARRETRQPSLGPAARPLAAGCFIGPMTEAERAGGMICSHPSCDPQIGVHGQIMFVAMRPLQPGEAATHDWATPDAETYARPCHCGAAN